MKIKLNDKVSIDLDKLIESRLLVQANSGGGKSFTIRRIIEQVFGHVQIIVIDPEGEFGNMRKEFDFVYAGKDGDAPAEPRSATLLARRLLELKASAVIDLYELPPKDRKHFVRLFCESLVNAPKELWHDVLVIIDEAHVFAPEKDQSEALGAVIDLASRGRKRGYCLIPATQRPAKLNKDVAAECNNKLIGRASLDIDRKRSAEELGLTSKEDVLSLRDLAPGEFYAFGPAISREVIKLEIGDVKVKPPKRGAARQSVAAPSATVKKMLAKLSDLPAEAAEEAKTVEALKAEINRLKRDSVQKIVRNEPKEPEIMGVSQWMNYGKKYGYWDFFEKKIMQAAGLQWEKIVQAWKKLALYQVKRVNELHDGFSVPIVLKEIPDGWMTPSNLEEVVIKQKDMRPQIAKSEPIPRDVSTGGRFGDDILQERPEYSDKPLSRGALTVLTYLESVFPAGRTKAQMSVASLYVPGGGFSNMVSELTSRGLILKAGNNYVATKKGETDYFPSLENWIPKVSLGAGKVFKILLDNYNDTYSKERLSNETGYTLGGGFSNMLSELTSKELVIKVGKEYQVNPEMLDL